ncbi:MAG: rubredoxin [Cyanobacteria bacterium QS_7_48_42]|jgi:rubredoxin|nr:MAG: rubredoxin [Cyanobacteria bacterium QH_2_48_84]PSO59342.1 MAG: rubredoxin [Cyanobacteria bacterium QH_10_48_56]PSO67834.1 MAG: rubredoxin [Cyanobacteria bacterium QH_7_48_89]PSO73977.1 MAG: rubredoxin [Cyanobacteria bacterium QH_3_48_40]PSO74056.1 MAG: rubredoxin [Cyanobacteria bacterium QS_1_48_34]PSO80981.1 MAG: rubredoxin [Cyanobacteria bacterium QS_5_48_63]PSO81317.1 MAG: rubredoxin [Cyanobacteria bacterium QS_4_48_99]PSO82501.1 MAG: rubredoxin [Cyanobacteria bacterium QH_9_48_43
MTDPADEQTLAEQAPARYECRSCGYVYEPSQGDGNRDIPSGTPFEKLPSDWRCPVCGARSTLFKNIGSTGAPSGFKSNLSYGFGVNRLTPAQKNLLIFGGLVLGFLAFMSAYGLG